MLRGARAALHGPDPLAPLPALRVGAAPHRAARDLDRARLRTDGSTTRCSAVQARLLLLAAVAGVGIARYYVLVTWATVVALFNYLRRGVPATWEAAEGTR